MGLVLLQKCAMLWIRPSGLSLISTTSVSTVLQWVTIRRLNSPSTHRYILLSIDTGLHRSNHITSDRNFQCRTSKNMFLSTVWFTGNSTRFFSSKEGDTPIKFAPDANCLVYSIKNHVLLKLKTVEDAESFARSTGTKLNLMETDENGVFVFKLVEMSRKESIESGKQKASKVSIPTGPVQLYKKKEKKKRDTSLKSFNVKSKSSEHDILVKTNQIQKHLDNGKHIEIHYTSSRNCQGPVFEKEAKKFKEKMSDLFGSKEVKVQVSTDKIWTLKVASKKPIT